MMTRVGPFVLSGLEAAVSVDGPIASVSARVRLVGGVGFAAGGEVGAAAAEGCISEMCGLVDATCVVRGVSESCAAMFAGVDAAAGAWSVRISTGLGDGASGSRCGRAPGPATCVALCEAVVG